MRQCAYCSVEAESYDGDDAAVCAKCAKHQIRSALLLDLILATERAKETREASELSAAVIGDIPGGILHPDGVQRIRNASREASAARNAMLKALTRLCDCLDERTTPGSLETEAVRAPTNLP